MRIVLSTRLSALVPLDGFNRTRYAVLYAAQRTGFAIFVSLEQTSIPM